MKIFACDIDDTVYSHINWGIHPRVKRAFKDLAAAKVPIVFATARILAGVAPFLKELGLNKEVIYTVACNGSEVFYDHYLYEAAFPKDVIATIYEYAINNGFAIGVDQSDHILINELNEAFDDDRRSLPIDLYLPDDFLSSIIDPVHKISLTGEGDFVKERFPQVFKDLSPIASASNAGIGYIDIVLSGHDKAFGLKKLLEYIKKSDDKVYYIGDGYNDIPLMKMADVSACVGNAKEECKEICDIITASCEEGGVADFIYQLINEEI